MKIKRDVIKGQWVDFEGDVRLQVRPFPASEGLFTPTNAEEMSEATWARFNYCLLRWEGLKEEDDSEFEFNEDNKRFVFNYIQDIVLFVITQTRIMEGDITKELGEL
jgi:hypothetical protein